MSDLNLKYQRLASEYGKMKAQNQVLRKAVVDQKENLAKLHEEVQMKEQTVRRSQQEIESSNFRNQQMVRRIEILQREMDGKKKGSAVAPDESSHHQQALDDDLKLKIEENARLHKQLHQIETRTREREQALQDEVTRLSAHNQQHKELKKELEEEKETVVRKNREEKAFLEKKLIELESEQRETKSRDDELINALRSDKQRAVESRDALERCVGEVIVFDDRCDDAMTRFCVRPNDKHIQQKAKMTIGAVSPHVTSLLADLIKFHDNSRKRALLHTQINQLPTTDKLSDCLQQSIATLDQLSKGYTSAFVEHDSPVALCGDLRPLVAACRRYRAQWSVAMRYHMIQLRAESDASLCVPNLVQKNTDYLANIAKVFPAFDKVLQYFVLLFRHDSEDEEVENTQAVIRKLCAGLNDLHLTFKELARLLNAKVSIEYQLPTTSQSHDLKSANQHLIAAMLQISSTSAKLAAALRQHELFFAAEFRPLARSRRPDACLIYERACGFMQEVNTYAPPPSVPYDEALRLREAPADYQHQASRERDEEALRRVSELEQEREHLLLETQLLQMKLSNSKTTPETATTSTARARTDSSNPTDVSSLGTLSRANDESTLEIQTESTEELIKRHMTERLQESARRQQRVESRAEHLAKENARLERHLRVCTKQVRGMEQQVSESSQQISSLRDELLLTSKNYEQQLSLMTEHLAAMNEKLAAQQETIESLKNKKSSKMKVFS